MVVQHIPSIVFNKYLINTFCLFFILQTKTMASSQTHKPTCLQHDNTAQVLCKTDRQFLCTQCLIEKEHSDNNCQLAELSKMKSRGELMLVDLILSHHIAENKLRDREGVEEVVEGEKERVSQDMDDRCNTLKQKLDEMMEQSKKEMVIDFDKQLEKATKEKATLSKVMDTLRVQIDKLASGDEGHLSGSQYHKVYDKQYSTRSTLSRITDRDFACFGKFELANNLREIEIGKKKIFGKATMLSRTMPRNAPKTDRFPWKMYRQYFKRYVFMYILH